MEQEQGGHWMILCLFKFPFSFLTILLGERKGIRPVKNLHHFKLVVFSWDR